MMQNCNKCIRQYNPPVLIQNKQSNVSKEEKMQLRHAMQLPYVLQHKHRQDYAAYHAGIKLIFDKKFCNSVYQQRKRTNDQAKKPRAINW